VLLTDDSLLLPTSLLLLTLTTADCLLLLVLARRSRGSKVGGRAITEFKSRFNKEMTDKTGNAKV